MSSQTEYINKLRADVTDAEKQLQALLEKREAYKSLIVKLDAEERSLSKKLQETKAKFRDLSGAAQTPAKSSSEGGVLKEVSQFYHLAAGLPGGVLFVKPTGAAKESALTLTGPETEDVYSISDVVSARTVSTYPLMPGGKKRQGSPICDQYYVQAQPDRLFVCVADGCNWGERPRDAARAAAKAFVTFAVEHFIASYDVRECGKMLLSAMKSAHNSIIANKDDLWEAGTTTLVGGVVIPLMPPPCPEGSPAPSEQDKSNIEYGICLLSIGDCKCFLWESATGKVRDITVDNRGNLLDPTDPGGRLGPTVGGGQPDTRNLTLFFERCHENDVIMLCSDGVHDNLDPSSLGVDPEVLSPKFAGKNWDEACKLDYDLAASVKRNFSAQRLADLMNGKGSLFTTDFGPLKSDAAGPTVSKGKDLNLEEVATDITEYCLRVTQSSRDFMENSRDKLPKDYKRYPGKMDHTTCVLVRARSGTFERNPEITMKVIPRPGAPESAPAAASASAASAEPAAAAAAAPSDPNTTAPANNAPPAAAPESAASNPPATLPANATATAPATLPTGALAGLSATVSAAAPASAPAEQTNH